MEITASEVAKELSAHDNFLIISHQNPDGDTLGCAFSLYHALLALGKRARIVCPNLFPSRFDYLYEGYQEENFVESYIVAVDVAARQMLGGLDEIYGEKVDLCIDHHSSNERYAKKTYVSAKAAAACELIFEVIELLGVKITPQMANCLYTGIATDTGCFKFSNTTENTHIVAAKMFELGANHAFINQYLFDTKSKARLAIEKQVVNSVEFFCEDRVAVICISQKMIREFDIDESELDGVAAIPRTIEGVIIGITFREKQNGSQKISVRTTSEVDASELCAQFGGGGHARAAGCQINSDYETAKERIIKICEKFLPQKMQ